MGEDGVILTILRHGWNGCRQDLAGVVFESTHNWCWLADGLMEQGYPVHLANTVTIQQYDGLELRDDNTDARWLAKLLRDLLRERRPQNQPVATG